MTLPCSVVVSCLVAWDLAYTPRAARVRTPRFTSMLIFDLVNPALMSSAAVITPANRPVSGTRSIVMEADSHGPLTFSDWCLHFPPVRGTLPHDCANFPMIGRSRIVLKRAERRSNGWEVGAIMGKCAPNGWEVRAGGLPAGACRPVAAR